MAAVMAMWISVACLIGLQGAVADLAYQAAGDAYEYPSEKDFIAEDELRATFEPDAFVFDFGEAEPEVETPGGSLRPSVIFTNPFLGTLPGDGNAQNLVTLEACGVNQPHHHPRGTETSFIVKGELLFGLVEENGGRVITTNLTQGQAISVPQGLSHFAQNLGCEPAQFLANFPNRDPGVQTELAALVRLPRETLRGTFLLDDDAIDMVIAAAGSQGNPSIEPECAKRCGIEVPDGGAGGEVPNAGPEVEAPAPA